MSASLSIVLCVVKKYNIWPHLKRPNSSRRQAASATSACRIHGSALCDSRRECFSFHNKKECKAHALAMPGSAFLSLCSSELGASANMNCMTAESAGQSAQMMRDGGQHNAIMAVLLPCLVQGHTPEHASSRGPWPGGTQRHRKLQIVRAA